MACDLQLCDAGAGAVFILLRGPAADPAGAFDDTVAEDRHGALPECLVTYDIEQAGEAVRLTMTEAHQWDIPEAMLSGGRAGWPAILSSLKSVLETGKPLSIGGSEGRADATGRGAVFCIEQAAEALGMPLRGARVAVQGFGKRHQQSPGGGQWRLALCK